MTSANRPKPSRLLLNILGWLVSVGFLVAFWQQLGAQQDWGAVLGEINAGLFLLSLALLAAGHYARSQLGYVSTRFLGYPITRAQSHRYWSLSQLAKYLPGGVWLFAAKVVLYNRQGMPLMVASAATMWELLAVVMVGLAFGVTTIGVLGDMAWAGVITLGSLLLIGGMVLSLSFWPWRLLAGWRLRGAGRMVSILEALGRRRYALLAHLAVWCGAIWLITGGGFYLMMQAMPLPGGVSLWSAIVIYAVAWTIGFLVFVTPAGLGPREAVLTFLLAPVYGPETAFTIALVARLWWALAEAIHIGLAVGIGLVRNAAD